MKGLVLLGTLAFIAGACWQSVRTDSDESGNNSKDNLSATKNKKNPNKLINKIVGCNDFGETESIPELNMDYLISNVKKSFTNKNVNKVAVMFLDKLINECPDQKSLAILKQDGVDVLFISVDIAGNIIKINCLIADTIDAEVVAKLGDEGMIVINR